MIEYILVYLYMMYVPYVIDVTAIQGGPPVDRFLRSD